MSVTTQEQVSEERPRTLPAQIVIPPIRGEMVHLRQAVLEDLPVLDELHAYYNASGITGKDQQAERAAVHAWVRRSVAWTHGQSPEQSGVGDPESRRTIAWSILANPDGQENSDQISDSSRVIGMIFLIDIDGWARSARIQVMLGKDFRGRGYSRDAMPRVMTFGFASAPAGLGMHRIWVAVPEKNTRSLSVYQSLGFVPSGTSRDALWDAENGKYQDLIVMDTLVDEYDPIRSLDAFGMHIFEDNPGVKEALSAREHSIAIQQSLNSTVAQSTAEKQELQAAERTAPIEIAESHVEQLTEVLSQQAEEAKQLETQTQADTVEDLPAELSDTQNAESMEEGSWPFTTAERKSSKDAWWRNLGRSRKRESEGK